MEGKSILRVEEPRLKDALAIQARVVWALIMRELKTRFGKNQLGYIWAILEPCIHISIWFVIFIVIRQKSGTGSADPLLILTTGIIPFFFVRRTYTFMGKAINSNQALLHYPLVRHLDLIIARFILEGATMSFVAAFLICMLTSLKIVVPPTDLLKIFTSVGALLWLALGFGTFNAVATILSPTYDKLLSVVGRLLYFTSGIHFLGEQLPQDLLKFFSYNPLFHGVELFREGYIYNYQSSFASYGYVAIWGIGFLIMGLLLERAAREQLRDS